MGLDEDQRSAWLNKLVIVIDVAQDFIPAGINPREITPIITANLSSKTDRYQEYFSIVSSSAQAPTTSLIRGTFYSERILALCTALALSTDPQIHDFTQHLLTALPWTLCAYISHTIELYFDLLLNDRAPSSSREMTSSNLVGGLSASELTADDIHALCVKDALWKLGTVKLSLCLEIFPPEDIVKQSSFLIPKLFIDQVHKARSVLGAGEHWASSIQTLLPYGARYFLFVYC